MPLSVASQKCLLTLFSLEFPCTVTSVVASHIAPNSRAKMGGTYIKIMPTAFLIVNGTDTDVPEQHPFLNNPLLD